MTKTNKKPYILSIQRESKFTMMPNSIFQSDLLSTSEKVFFGYLASLPDGVDVTQTDMAKAVKMTERTVRRILNSLESKKIVAVERGKFTTNTYTLNDIKEWLESDLEGQKCPPTDVSNVRSEVASNVRFEPDTSVRSPYNKYLLKKNISQSDKKGESTPPVQTFDFEAAYKLYPRKIRKKDTFKKLAAEIKTQAQYDQLLSGIKNFAALVVSEKREPRFIPHFSTFVNNSSWLDYQDEQQDGLGFIDL